MATTPPQFSSGGDEPLFRPALAIVVVGILLGVGQNWLIAKGTPAKALPWIAKEKVLDHLEEVLAKPPEPTPAAEATPSPEPDRTPAVPVAETAAPPAVAPPEAPASAEEPLPEIPDLGRPLQMQLPAVKRFFDAGAAVIVDARDHEEYAAGHITGAVHLPYEEVITDPARLEAFDPHGKPIIIYCGGGTCEVSMNLAFAMIQAGKSRLLVFMGGYPEWEAAGYPITKGPAPGGAAR